MQKIIHIDADCFFAALELRDKPELRGQAVAVGGDPGRRGVIATCNYEARAFGVRSAMPSSRAKQLCPHLVILNSNMAKYRDASVQMHEIFSDYSSAIEPLSLDEAYLDVSSSSVVHGSATLIARDIRHRIKCELGITVSAGVSRLKFLSKIASDWYKPNGLTVVAPKDEIEFISRLSVKKLPGVGPVMRDRLALRGIYSCKDLQNCGLEDLILNYGAFGERLFNMSRAVDPGVVKARAKRKCISVESTFETDLRSAAEIKMKLPLLMTRLKSRAPDETSFASQFVKVKFDDFSQKTMESRIGLSAQEFPEDNFLRMMLATWHQSKKPVRLLGVGLKVSEAHHFGQLMLPF